jgi:hypothetical protein
MPKLAYFTADPVNEARLSELGPPGVQAEAFAAKELDRPTEAYVRLYDLDSIAWGRAERAVLIRRLLDGAGPAAVHSYNLDPDEVKRLRAAGVLTARRLTPRLLARLARQAARRSRREAAARR